MSAESIERPFKPGSRRAAGRTEPPARTVGPSRAPRTGFEPFVLAAGLGLVFWALLLSLILV